MYNKHMNFVLEALRDKPQALYLLDDTSPFQDYSGYNRSGTAAGGTPAEHISLVRRASKGKVFGNSITASFGANVFNQGNEKQSFSLGAWVRVISPNDIAGEQQLLGNQNRMDGLVVSGTVISFVTKFNSAPEARASYDLQHEQAVYAVGVHTEDKNSLFINGELVAESTLTEEQRADKFATTSTNLYTGATSSTQLIAVNGLSIFASALEQEAIVRHYEAGRLTVTAEEIATMHSGDSITLSLANSDLFLDQWWSTAEDWSFGTLFNTSVSNDKLIPQFDGSTSVPGEWIDSISLETANATSIAGVVVNWDGEGATVECSLDGESWSPVDRGARIDAIVPGFDPTEEALLVKISFPGGIENDPAYVDNLNVVGIRTSTTEATAGRVVSMTSSTPKREYVPSKLHENWGVRVGAGGSLTISEDTSEDDTPARTIELWIKATTATNPTVNVTGTRYINGSTGSATLPTDQWVLMHIVASADVTGNIVVNGPAQVGRVNIYSTPLSAAEIADIYKEYTGTNTRSANDNSVVTVADSASGPKIYAHDWSIQSSG